MKEITLEQALKLVSFEWVERGFWRVHDVTSVHGDVRGFIRGDVLGNIVGTVHGRINNREWKFVETPKDKLQRLITESGNQELIDTFNQLKDNND